jgi:hypothetical protein
MKPRLTVRHYCQGIGDCHLIRIPRSNGTDFFMLIDCGVHSSVRNGHRTIRTIVEDIASVTTHIDVAVGTHEHWDHLSGFLTAAEVFDQVWLAWTENPADPQGRQLDKFKRDTMRALEAVGSRLAAAPALTPYLAGMQEGLEAMRGFVFGAKGERVRDARDNLVMKGQKGRNGVKYLEPSSAPVVFSNVPDLRVYVLGPPREPALLGLTDRAAEMYGMAGSGVAPLAAALGLSPDTEGARWIAFRSHPRPQPICAARSGDSGAGFARLGAILSGSLRWTVTDRAQSRGGPGLRHRPVVAANRFGLARRERRSRHPARQQNQQFEPRARLRVRR